MSLAERAARGYDDLAPDYELQLEQNPIARYMRKRVHEHLRIFKRGQRVLDLAAGTGADAVFLARNGVEVMAVDASPAMIAELRKAAERIAYPIKTQVLPAERLNELALSGLDGAISTFGGLNTIENLPKLALNLAKCLKPGGRLVLHALNQYCFWQNKVRDRQTVKLGSSNVVHQFYEPYALFRTTFAPYFDLRTVYGLSVVASPGVVRGVRLFAPVVIACDTVVGRLFPSAGDFFVMELVKHSG